MNTEQAIKWAENMFYESEMVFPFKARSFTNYATSRSAFWRCVIAALRAQAEREKGCVWCKEGNKVFHDGQHFTMFCSYCGKRLEVEQDG